jgi:hypothetical protein
LVAATCASLAGSSKFDKLWIDVNATLRNLFNTRYAAGVPEGVLIGSPRVSELIIAGILLGS